MKVELKEATIKDIDKLMKWRMEVLSEVFYQDALNSKKLYEENLAYYKKALNNNSYIGVFANQKETTIGCGGACLYDELPSPDNINGKCAYIMNIYVKKDYRSNGIGSLIVKELIKKARQRGVEKIFLESTEQAFPLYEKLGFIPMQGYLIFN